ncbi:hypothetical protein Q6350_12045 [Isoptericola sp. b515]|uniref:hypothetical protein n=1 Tax=Isoptericola sp. b515 TaxID=3064652 RepID=UPI00271231E0|nr:hypothetical protein [Isoptericola sp. b515]MDO8149161.1 hypothetical protein [Isoptericola sp. b515]
MGRLMRVAKAMLPDVSSSQDRILTTPTAVIVLDGASAFVPVAVSPATYVDTLGRFLVEGLSAEPEIGLPNLLAEAISQSASLLGLSPGSSPSSTVAIAREDGHGLDLLVLGDSQIATPHGIYVDNRLAHFAQPQRDAYRDRLAAGHGYDGTHRELLRALQTEQARHRNIDSGFWIAEAAPAAAYHAITLRVDLNATPWLVLATDGAYRPMRHLGLDDWAAIAARDGVGLGGLLKDLDRWEKQDDPDGLALPRAKRHDDKAIATLRYVTS